MAINYGWLYEQARGRFATDDALEEYLPMAKSAAELARRSDGYYLSNMVRRVFRAAMRHAVVDARWPAFEAAFWGFEPAKLVLLSPGQLEAFMGNAALIRHWQKMQTIPQNAQLVLELSEQHGGFGQFLAHWPDTDCMGLWRLLAGRGSRLGGRSAAAFLRMVGKDTFMLTPDVVAALVSQEVIDTSPTSQGAQRLIQAEFNRLAAASGRPLCQLSAMLALTINPRF